MKYLIKLLFSVIVIAIAFTACQKVGPLPFYQSGTDPVLTSSVTSTKPAPADSMKNVIAFSWTNPNYATSASTVKYILEFDSTGRNFSKEQTIVLTGVLTDTLTAKALNNILLALGFAYNTTYNVDVRITSSYGNNNVQLLSNVLTLQMTPYVVPPKVIPPSTKALFITGSATAGSWQGGNGSGVPVPAQQFTKLDSVTYQGTFYLVGGGQYVLLPINGDWSQKYAVVDATVSGLSAGGSFGYYSNANPTAFTSNIPAPALTGLYTIRVDFQHGTFTCTLVQQYGQLFVPGDYQGWTPATAPALGAPKNDGNFDGYVNITTTGGFKFVSGTTWIGDPGANGQSGVLSTSGGNLNIPSAGYYHIVANTVNNTWAAYPVTWAIIGSLAASNNWSNDIPMTFNASNNTWTATITTVAGDQFKFRANGSWDGTPQNPNLGDAGGTLLGSLSYGGNNIGDPSKNISIPAGTHNVTLYMGNGGYYTYMIQ